MNIYPDQVINSRYNIIEKIMDEVDSVTFSAKDIENNTNVAIKFIKKHAVSSYTEDIIRFEKEIEAVSKIDHISLLKSYEVGEFENIPYIVMELSKDEKLSHLLKRKKLFNIDETLEIIRQLTVVLSYVHSQGIVHRDIKPSNIIYSKHGEGVRIKLANFGLGLIMKMDELEDQESTKNIFGYLSPEATGILNKKLDERSDLYSLGLVLYHLLVGKQPFKAKQLDKLLYEQVAFNPPMPKRINKDIPEILEDITMKLIAKDPDLRYQSAEGLLHDIEMFQNGERDFVIGEKDQKIKLTYQTRLVGREEEIDKIKRLYYKAQEGKGSVCIIGGEAGIGKSKLVEEVRSAVYEQGGLFIEGKCFNQDNKIPYQPFKDAIDEYIRRIKKLSKDELDNEVARLKTILGDLEGIIVKLNPNIQNLLGEVKHMTELDPERENQRFLMVLSNFFCNLISKGNACVLFLDDLQWSDVGSINLLREILEKVNNSNLLVLGTYRDNEIQKGHELEKITKLLGQKDYALEDIKLDSLTYESLNKLISRLLGEKEENCQQLSKYVFKKSGGNAFFAIEIMHQLVYEKVLVYNNNRWELDTQKLESISVSSTIVDIILKRIDRLKDDLLKILNYGSVIGREFNINLLLRLSNLPANKVVNLVDEAINLQLLERDSVRERIIFVHDRVRDAFYARIEDSEKKKLHLEIAQELEQMYTDSIEEVLFDITHHFIEAQAEDKLLEYIIPAAKKAKQGYANDEAIKYYDIAVNLLEKKGLKESSEWIKAKEELAEVYLIIGNNDEVIKISQEILPFKETPLEKTKIYRQMSTAYFKKGDYTNCEDKMAKGLALLGENIPRTKNQVRFSIAKELFIHVMHCLFPKFFIRKNNKFIKPEYVEMSSCHVILDWMYIFSNVEKYCSSVLRALNNIESNIGESRELGTCMCGYGGLCMSVPMFKRAMRYHERAINIMRKLNNEWWIAQTIQIMSFGYLWKGDYKKCLDYIQESEEIFKRIGDLWELEIVLDCIGMIYYYTGYYDEAIDRFSQYLEISNKIKDNQGINTSFTYFSQLYIDTGDYEKSEQLSKQALKSSKEKNIWLSACVANINLGRLEVERGNFEEAIDYLEEAKKIFEENTLMRDYTVNLYPYLAEAYIEKFKTQSLHLSKKDRIQQLKKIKRACKKALRLTKPWVNHYGTALRVQGKYYSLIEKNKQAEEFLLESIGQTEKLNRKFELAKGYYEYGNFLNSLNKIEQAKKEWQKAYDIFKNIGAKAYIKVCADLLGYKDENIQQKNYTIQDRRSIERRMSTLLETSRYLSSILNINELLDKVTDKAIELTGAERGLLLLYPEEGYENLEIIVARNITKEDTINKEFEASKKIISKVENEKKPLIISDANSEDELKFQSIVSMGGLKSAICAPIVSRGKLLGIIYLDNRLLSNLFTQEDLNVLDVIATQAGVSISNARLYNQAIKDGLTDLYNRSFFDEYLMKNVHEANRYGNEVSLLLLDIDHFKMVNDNYGHQTGDLVLQNISQTLKRIIRRSDLVARYGGEEFAIILTETGVEGAKVVADKIRKEIEKQYVLYESEGRTDEVKVTVSIGLAGWKQGMDKLDLIDKADKALYKAKDEGRDRVVVWED